MLTPAAVCSMLHGRDYMIGVCCVRLCGGG